MLSSILQIMGFPSKAESANPTPKKAIHKPKHHTSAEGGKVSTKSAAAKGGSHKSNTKATAPKVAAKPAKASPVKQTTAVTATKPASKLASKTAVKQTSAKPTPKQAVPAKVVNTVASKAVAKPVVKAPVSPAPKASARIAPPVASATPRVAASYVPTIPADASPVTKSQKAKDKTLANNWKGKPADQLTDAELIAMPDSEYMNEVQLAAFRHRLVLLKQGILDNAGETTEHLREDTVVVPDPADRATIEEEHALELRTRDRERKLLKKIEQSIARIDAGDYGYCDETGEPIGVGRLLARPTATLSLEAQQRRELKQKMYGD